MAGRPPQPIGSATLARIVIADVSDEGVKLRVTRDELLRR
jgi:hypothetical protein